MECLINWLNSNSGSIVAIATVVYVLFTGWIIVQNRQLYIQNIRPYITVKPFTRNLMFYISIKNTGKLPAFDVKFGINKEVYSYERSMRELNLFKNGIKCFSPGVEYIVGISSAAEVFNEKNKEKFPKLFNITVKYNSLSESVQETIIIDLPSFLETEVPQKEIELLCKSLDEIKKEIEKAGRVK